MKPKVGDTWEKGRGRAVERRKVVDIELRHTGWTVCWNEPGALQGAKRCYWLDWLDWADGARLVKDA